MSSTTASIKYNTTKRAVFSGLIALLMLVAGIGATNALAQEIIDFEGIAPGTVLTSVNASGGTSVSVRGINADCPALEAAVIFDSSNPTGGDNDLGTPNEDFGGPGKGQGGKAGSPFQNDTALGNLLIVHEHCGDLGGGSVANPDDESGRSSILLEFPNPVTFFRYTILDKETTEVQNVALLDENDNLIATFTSPTTDNNGKAVVLTDLTGPGSGTPGVKKVVFERQGSRGLDDIVFCDEPAPETHTITFNNIPTGTIVSSVSSDLGFGPIKINAKKDACNANNAAVIFDTANPTGDDLDLGTPNQDFGGPGIGNGGKAGKPFQNTMALGKALIVHEYCNELKSGSGTVATPDDNAGGSKTTIKFPEPVTMKRLTVIDREASEEFVVKLYNGNTLLASFTAPATGNNGVGVIHTDQAGPGSGTLNVTKILIDREGSSAIDNIVFERPGSVCNLSAFNRLSEPMLRALSLASPAQYTLNGAYPNPFNPTTTIRFSMPEAAQLRLTVYDILGRKVALLLDGTLEAGQHEVPFDASSLPSGTYVYRLESPQGTLTGTLLLMK